jgi:hypothetical protein
MRHERVSLKVWGTDFRARASATPQDLLWRDKSDPFSGDLTELSSPCFTVAQTDVRPMLSSSIISSEGTPPPGAVERRVALPALDHRESGVSAAIRRDWGVIGA